MIECRATVIEAGPMAWTGEPVPRAKVGDKVLISKFTGAIWTGPLDGILYRVVNCDDIYCGIDDTADFKSLKQEDPEEARAVQQTGTRIRETRHGR